MWLQKQDFFLPHVITIDIQKHEDYKYLGFIAVFLIALLYPDIQQHAQQYEYFIAAYACIII